MNYPNTAPNGAARNGNYDYLPPVTPHTPWPSGDPVTTSGTLPPPVPGGAHTRAQGPLSGLAELLAAAGAPPVYSNGGPSSEPIPPREDEPTVRSGRSTAPPQADLTNLPPAIAASLARLARSTQPPPGDKSGNDNR